MKVFVALAVLLVLAAPLCLAEKDVNIETEVVGEELSGRALMRSLLGDDWAPGPQGAPGPKPPPKGKGPWGKKKPPPYEPKYKQKTCYATSTYEKEDECKTVVKKVKFYKKKTYVSSYPVTHTHTYVSTVTFPPVYKTYPVYYYEKKGWGDKYYLPKECEAPEPPPEWPQPEPKW